MPGRLFRFSRVLTGAVALAVLLPGAAAAVDAGSLQDLLYSNILVNLAFAAAIVFLGIFGLYAYASLARFAPYHTWIYLYLVSLTGIAWALFMAVSGGSLPDVVFVVTTVIGLNLIVHVLRFDRIEIPSPFGASAAAASQG
jgi:hypothetical protein